MYSPRKELSTIQNYCPKLDNDHENISWTFNIKKLDMCNQFESPLEPLERHFMNMPPYYEQN